MRFLDAGESHGIAMTCILDGMVSGLNLDKSKIDRELSRRQCGYGRSERMKIERDQIEFTAGVRAGKTLAGPISFMVRNAVHNEWKDVMDTFKKSNPSAVTSVVRAGHIDLAGSVKYGFTDVRNAFERASARETTMRVAVGAICKQFLDCLGIVIGSHVYAIGGVVAQNGCYTAQELIAHCDNSPVRCMDDEIGIQMKSKIDDAKKRHDTLGGEVEIVVSGIPCGIGSYAHYDRRLDYALMGALGSVQSVKAVAVGSKDVGALFGSEMQDGIAKENDRIYRTSNNAGGIEGGVSNGEDIVLRVALKPLPTLRQATKTLDLATKKLVITESNERSDICAVPSASVVLENVVAFELANQILNTLGGDRMDEVVERLAKKRADYGL